MANRPGARPRVKTPTVLQMEAVECGAAALGIVLAYHGRIVPLEVLRLQCGVSRDGSKASNVLKAARRFGLAATGYKKEPQDLRELEPPFIVFWNFNHFLVVEGFAGERVYLNDPAAGPRVVSDTEFDQSFTGVVLVCAPGPEFRRGGERRSLWRSLKDRIAGSRKGLLYVVLAGLALVVPGILIPAFSQIFVDRILVNRLEDWVRPLVVAMVVTALVRCMLTYLQRHHLLRLEAKLSLVSASRFLWHVLRLPVEFFGQRYAGDVAVRVGLNDRLAQLLSGRLAQTAVSAVMIGFFAAVMLRYDAGLTLVGVGVALLNVVALRLVSRRRVDLSRKVLQEQAKLMATATQGLTGIETLKATGAEGDFFARWSGYQAKVSNAEQQLEVASRWLAEVPVLLQAILTVAILTLGGLRVMEGYLSVGMLVAFQSLMASFIGPVNDLVGLGSTLQNVEADMNRLDDVLSYRTDALIEAGESAEEREGRGAAPRKLKGHLEVRHASFGYSRLAPPLIEGFDLVLEPGARVALVGSSGSGKSTVSKLVAGLYEPWAGEIRFDGVPRAELPRHVVTGSVALVDQDIFLFEGTVRDNITLWDRTVSEAAWIQAAKDACIHEDITARPGSYLSRVSEGGRNFSGGQRQRLELARALAGDPTILILDEATSALDPRTEKLVDDNLRIRRVTCLFVAHRLSTIRDCDEILVLERGKVVQRGTHEEMRDVDGPYRRLIQTG